MNHYPHHIGDFSKDTLGFSQGEIGAYRLLMDAYYANEESIDQAEVYVIGRATTPAERRNVDKALRKFELRDGRYYHKRIEEELSAFRERSKTGTENIRKRWQIDTKPDTKSDTKSIPIEYQTDTDGVLASSHKPITQPGKEQHYGIRDIPAPEGRVAALRSLCGLNRVSTTGRRDQMHVEQWAAEGVTDQQLADAIAIGRERLPEPQVLRIAYLAPIVSDLRSGAIPPRTYDPDAVAMAAIAAIAEKEANATH